MKKEARHYFGPAYAIFYRWLIPREQTEAEARFLVEWLKPRRGERWLDVPCGYGRHLKALRELRPGLRLYGADLNAEYLREPELARVARLCRSDMARLPFADGSFRVVLNLLNSFGYHHQGGGDARDRQVLAEFARVLRPGGRLALDLPNRRAVIATVRTEPIMRYAGDGLEAIEEFEWDREAQTLNNKTRWRWPGGSERGSYRLRLYTPAQAKRLIERSDLELETMFGDFRGSAFNPYHSDRMLIIAKKPQVKRI